MAIYIYLQCCKCKNSHKLHLYSFSFNQYEIFNNLCEHFNIKYTYITNFGFFTLGWSITLEVKVAETDIGKVIGKQGRIAKSIRTVMKSIAGREHKRINVEFID